MRLTLTLVFLIILTTGSFAKGSAGTYYIKGTAYGAGNTILKNTELIVKIGSFTKSIRTDENGFYEIQVPWESACPSLRTYRQHKSDNKKLNPEFIYISYNNKEVKLVNNWKKYSEYYNSKEKTTRKKDLYLV